MKKRLGLWLAIFILVAPAWGQGADLDLPVPMQLYNGIRYYSLGVSTDERKLPQLYLLKLVFATDQGHMLTGADVTLSANGKDLFRGQAENGPWMIIDLPPGTYDIEAVQDGVTRSVKGVVIAPGKKRSITLRWKTTEVKMGL